MNVRALFLLGGALAAPLQAGSECRLCAAVVEPVRSAAERPLTIEIDTALDFSRASGGNGGTIDIDAHSGTRRVTGLVDLGGIAIKGSVRLTGTPLRRVRVGLPASIRLTAANGAAADAVDLRSDLPPGPVLGSDGRLGFSFGGRLVVAPGASGEFHGRIPITAEYE